MALGSPEFQQRLNPFIDQLHDKDVTRAFEHRQTPPLSYINPITVGRASKTHNDNALCALSEVPSSSSLLIPRQFESLDRRTQFPEFCADEQRQLMTRNQHPPKPSIDPHRKLFSQHFLQVQAGRDITRPIGSEALQALGSRIIASSSVDMYKHHLERSMSHQFTTLNQDFQSSLSQYNDDENFHLPQTSGLQIMPSEQPQSPSILSSATQLLNSSIAVRVRHDRKSFYTVRERADVSKSLIKLPTSLHINIEQIQNQLDVAPGPMVQEEGFRHDEEPLNDFDWLINAFQQMMFVSGETAEPSTETTWMIEEIVREQVVEMLKEATGLANRRGSKSISIVDLIFQIRHNPAKVSRLKTFLSWKDVRKNVKDSDDKAGGADDALDLEDGALPGANPAAPQKSSANKKAKLVLPWEVQSFYNETVPEREDEEDEEEEEQNEATLARLASADERTKNMTKEEYVYWSDCRQASFTFRKGKRFREWAGFGTIIDSKPNDDVVDILGFLTFEIVQTLTEEALRVKAAEDLANKKASGIRGDNEANKKRKREGCTLFEMPEEDRTPVEPKHVREAFRRLQIVPSRYKFLRPGYAGVRTPLRMI